MEMQYACGEGFEADCGDSPCICENRDPDCVDGEGFGEDCEDGAECEVSSVCEKDCFCSRRFVSCGAVGGPTGRDGCVMERDDICGDDCENCLLWGSACIEGECVCQDGWEVCDGICREVKVDDDHCGACHRICGDGGVCSESHCVCGIAGTVACGDGEEVDIGGLCVPEQDDRCGVNCDN